MTFDRLPRSDPDYGASEHDPLATAGFLDSGTVIDAFGIDDLDEAQGKLLLGHVGGRPVGYADDRHVITLAGSRSGKGTALIMPNLLHYRGSVIVIDPKGENASVTAKWRAEVLGQRVVVLDPFKVAKVDESLRGHLNPLDDLHPDDPEVIDDAAGLADALMMGKSKTDAHWDETARAFLKGAILYLLLSRRMEDCHLGALEELVFRGEPLAQGEPDQSPSSDNEQSMSGTDRLLHLMAGAADVEGTGMAGPIIASIGSMMLDMGERERGSVLSTARRQVEFLQTPLMRDHLSQSTVDLAEARDPYGLSLYIVLPEWRLESHARWLRLVITLALQKLQRTEKREGQPPVLFILNEFANLGRLTAVERAASYIAGFGVKLWAVLQDLGQLKDSYKDRWETFIGNAGLITAFANTDLTSLKYLSEKLDDVEVLRQKITTSESSQSGRSDRGLGRIFEGLAQDKGVGLPGIGADSVSSGSSFQASMAPDYLKTRLMTPDEIARYFSRRGADDDEALLALMAGISPMRLTKFRYYRDAPFADRAAPNPYYL